MRYDEIIGALVSHGVDFIIVGGAAAIAHGSSRLTADLDIVYSRKTANLELLVTALEPLQPKLRAVGEDVAFRWDVETLKRGLNFTLTTSAGPLDLFGEIIGGGDFDQLVPHSVSFNIFGYDCLVLGLKRLIEAKRAAARPKDFDAVAELELILSQREV